MTLRLIKMKRPATGLAVALTLLSQRPPFDKAALGPMVQTVSGAIKRGHYVFTMRGRDPCGFTCWAVLNEAAARGWSAGHIPLAEEIAADGDVVVILQGVFDARDAVNLGFRHIAALNPGKQWVMHRYGRRNGVTWGRFADPARGMAEVDLV